MGTTPDPPSTHVLAPGRHADALRRLTGLTKDIRTAALLTVSTMELLDTALAITATDLGLVQLVDVAGGLVVVAGAGFERRILGYLDAVGNDSASSCGRALRRREQVVIPDVELDLGCRPYRTVAAAAGFRAVQSTPLLGPDSAVLGVVSTYFHRPHRPSDRRLRSLLSSGRSAGAELASLVGGRPARDPSGDTAAGLPDEVLTDLVTAYAAAVDEVADLRTAVAQLERALTSRIVIEQAKGIISVTNRVDVDRAFQLLRDYARSHSSRVHDIAAAVVSAELHL